MRGRKGSPIATSRVDRERSRALLPHSQTGYHSTLELLPQFRIASCTAPSNLESPRLEIYHPQTPRDLTHSLRKVV